MNIIKTIEKQKRIECKNEYYLICKTHYNGYLWFINSNFLSVSLDIDSKMIKVINFDDLLESDTRFYEHLNDNNYLIESTVLSNNDSLIFTNLMYCLKLYNEISFISLNGHPYNARKRLKNDIFLSKLIGNYCLEKVKEIKKQIITLLT